MRAVAVPSGVLGLATGAQVCGKWKRGAGRLRAGSMRRGRVAGRRGPAETALTGRHLLLLLVLVRLRAETGAVGGIEGLVGAIAQWVLWRQEVKSAER